MLHETPLIAMIVAGIVLAFLFGTVAQRLRISPLVGYLLAGVAVGPFTPGFVADAGLAAELAEIGVILLMFGVGLHFSLNELLAVRRIAIPGAIAQIAVATLMGAGLAAALGLVASGGHRVRARALLSPAPSCFCARSRSAACSRPTGVTSPSAG